MLTGWDRPLQHFFVNIDRKCTKCGGDGGFGEEPNDADLCPLCMGSGNEYLFNNLDAPQGYTDRMGGMTLEQVVQVLNKKLTWYPPELINELAQDRGHNIGNLIETYDTGGVARA